MRIRDNNRWGNLPEDVDRAFETRHNIRLPADYRSYRGVLQASMRVFFAPRRRHGVDSPALPKTEPE